MGDSKKIPTPKIVQSFVKALYLVGMSLILTCVFIFVGLVLYNTTYTELFPLYLVSQFIVTWVYVNGNIKIEYEW